MPPPPYEVIGVSLGVCMAVISMIFIIPPPGVTGWDALQHRRKLKILILILGFTAWIWMTWLCYGLSLFPWRSLLPPRGDVELFKPTIPVEDTKGNQ